MTGTNKIIEEFKNSRDPGTMVYKIDFILSVKIENALKLAEAVQWKDIDIEELRKLLFRGVSHQPTEIRNHMEAAIHDALNYMNHFGYLTKPPQSHISKLDKTRKRN